MFDSKSRYYKVPNLTVTTTEGHSVTYKARRVLPSDEQQATTLGQITVTASDRLDLIAARIYGDPLKFWQICDANQAIFPASLIQVGQVLRILPPTT